MPLSRRELLRTSGSALGAGTLLGGLPGRARAHAEVADEFRPAHDSNFEDAERTTRDVRWLVLHTIEGSREAGISWFQNPAADVSAHFVVGNEPDQITQMVHCENVAWSQGNGAYNETGVSIEIEGYANETRFNDHVYEQVAAVARWVCDRYDVPVRHPTYDIAPCDAYDGEGGIVGHNQIPDPADCSQVTDGKVDPGDTWDWERFLRLVRDGDDGDDGGCGNGATRREGSLSGVGDTDAYTYRGQAGNACRLTVSLSGPSDADFDLFVTMDGRTPSRSDHDRASTGSTSEESIVLGPDSVGDDSPVGIAVNSFYGDGEYSLSVTRGGTASFREGQWVHTTGDGWGYYRPREGARRLERLSTYTHGRIVNGPVRNDGRVWWGLHLVNEEAWAWVPAGRLTGAPGGPRFTLGDRVHTTETTTVRRRPDDPTAVVERKPAGAGGEMVNSATRSDGRVWWGIRFDDGTAAWCPQGRLSE